MQMLDWFYCCSNSYIFVHWMWKILNFYRCVSSHFPFQHYYTTFCRGEEKQAAKIDYIDAWSHAPIIYKIFSILFRVERIKCDGKSTFIKRLYRCMQALKQPKFMFSARRRDTTDNIENGKTVHELQPKRHTQKNKHRANRTKEKRFILKCAAKRSCK